MEEPRQILDQDPQMVEHQSSLKIENVPGINLLKGAFDTLTFKPVFKRLQRYDHDYVLKIKDDGCKFVLDLLAHDDIAIMDGSKNEKYLIVDPTVELQVPHQIMPGTYRMYNVGKCGTTVTLTKDKKEADSDTINFDGATMKIQNDGSYYKVVAKTRLIAAFLDNKEAADTFVDHVSYTLVFLALFIGIFIGLCLGLLMGLVHV